MTSIKLSAYLFSAYLADLNRASTLIKASAVISNDGLILAAAVPVNIDEHYIAALSAALISQSACISQALSAGAVNHLLLKNEENNVLLVHIGKDALLTVVFDRYVNTETAFADMAWAITASAIDELRYLYNAFDSTDRVPYHLQPLAMAY